MLRAVPRVVLRSSFRATRMTLVAVPRYARYESTVASGASAASPTPEQLKKQRLREQDDLQRDWDAKTISYEDLKPRTEQPNPETYLIDVREPDEVLQGSIPSSVNLPLSVLSNSLNMHPEAFKARFGWEKPRKDQEIIFYCRSGKRSSSACDIAKRNGFSSIINYQGSWLDWISKEGQKSA